VTKDAGGNEGGTLLNGLFSSFTGVFISPALLTFFLSHFDSTVIKQTNDIYHYLRVIGKLSLTALLPVIVGQIINCLWTEQIRWAKTKFYFSKIMSIALLALVWTVLCDIFKGHMLQRVNKIELLIILIVNALIFVVFTLLAFIIARLPNIFICRKRGINQDHKPLLPEHQSKSSNLIERWRFSREDTVTFMCCGITKTLSLGLLLINTNYSTQNPGFVGLLSLPLLLYYVELLILCFLEIMVLKRWFPSENGVNV
jgi:sodium/bile acid cotransporter 7